MKNKSGLYVAITGLIMGMAEVIPGVSGGTVAFVAGIYERLLQTISGLRTVPSLLVQRNWKELNTTLQPIFLIQLGVGMIIGIVIGVAVITNFLESHPPVVWAFFFGLILASVVYMAAKVKWKTILPWLFFLIGVIIATLVGLIPLGAGSTSLLFVFFSGMIAIVALVLPGISGSFILLILGMYTYIVGDVVKGILVEFTWDKVITLVIFALGCLVGLLSVARGLQWAFKTYPNRTIALLTGFMLGALPKIWPWRNPTRWLEKETGNVMDQVPVGEFKVLEEVLVLPGSYMGTPFLVNSQMAIVIGVVTVLLFWKFEKE